MIVRNSSDIGSLIRERRVALGLDQQALAERIGVQRLWVVQVEGGKPRARVELVLRALEVLGLELHVVDPNREGTPPESPDIDAVVERARGVAGQRASKRGRR
jgi:HTH-type transcriptional regulator/antitoxin HipB